jgi:hypothetical protein
MEYWVSECVPGFFDQHSKTPSLQGFSLSLTLLCGASKTASWYVKVFSNLTDGMGL